MEIVMVICLAKKKMQRHFLENAKIVDISFPRYKQRRKILPGGGGEKELCLISGVV